MKCVLALGAENKTSFAVMNGKKVFVSAPAGTLSEVDNYNRYFSGIQKYLAKNKIRPDIIACDLHPDYMSTAMAEELEKQIKGARLVRVQHHFAHIVSCMFDNGIDEDVIGVSFDGTGYGTDGRSWGGEIITCSRKSFRREFHLKYMPVPGGDLAASEIWRMGLSYLYKAYGRELAALDIPLIKRIGRKKAALVEEMIDKDINSPFSSSAGRLFDAVASITGICDIALHEAEGAIKLEKAAEKGITDHYKFDIQKDEIDVLPAIRGVADDMKKGLGVPLISAKFHNTIVEFIFEAAKRVFSREGMRKVLFSGGCFQNRFLIEHLGKRFRDTGFEIYTHKNYPATDVNISIGQAVVASGLLK